MLPDRKTTTGPTKGIPHTVGLFQERNMRTKGKPSEGKPNEGKRRQAKRRQAKASHKRQAKASR